MISLWDVPSAVWIFDLTWRQVRLRDIFLIWFYANRVPMPPKRLCFILYSVCSRTVRVCVFIHTYKCTVKHANLRPSVPPSRLRRLWVVTSETSRWTRRRRWPTLFTWWRAARAAWTRKATAANRWTELLSSRNQHPPPMKSLWRTRTHSVM